MKYKNTIQKGSVRILVFREKDTWYAIGLEFNIVESGDNPREAMLLLLEALQGYAESAKKVKARPHVLNQKSDSEYEEMWEESENEKYLSKVPIYFRGELNLSQLKGSLFHY